MQTGIRRLLALCALALPLAALASAQNGVQVNARLTSGIVKLGSSAALLLEVEGANQAQPAEAPEVEGLHFGRPGSPSRQSFFSFAGGVRSSSSTLTWSFPITADHKGEFKIPPFEVSADGRTYRSNELWLRVVEDLQGEQLGRFEIHAPSTVVEGQPFTVELDFGWDTRADVNRANLSLPWYGELGGVVELDPPVAEPGARKITGVMINSGGDYAAEALPNQRTDQGEFTQLRIRRRFLCSRAGKLEFPTSHLEFGKVTQDFLLQRESKLYYKRFPDFTIDVVALPEKDRPLDFSGAVGELHASARADRTDVDVGDSIKLNVEWTGDGNLEFFTPPELDRLDAFEGFRMFGKTDRKTADRRVVTYDLAPTHDRLKQIPPVPLTVFDPKQGAYVTISTPPVPIRVRPLKNATTLGEERVTNAGSMDIQDIQTEPESASAPFAPSPATVLSLLALCSFGWIGARTLVRRNGDPASPILRARRRARRVLERELSRSPRASEQAQALHRFLAARTGERSEAWVGRDLEAWRESRPEETRPPTQAALSLAQLERELDERIWAGSDAPLERARVLAIADELLQGGL
ncbi:MAG: BatD family protein [Planctomycetes bacterium]|nr:BatD family protein [Planctomycetota bacterium]